MRTATVRKIATNIATSTARRVATATRVAIEMARMEPPARMTTTSGDVVGATTSHPHRLVTIGRPRAMTSRSPAGAGREASLRRRAQCKLTPISRLTTGTSCGGMLPPQLEMRYSARPMSRMTYRHACFYVWHRSTDDTARAHTRETNSPG